MNAVRFGTILAIILAPATLAVDYFPLTTGSEWSYTMSNGMQMKVVIAGAAPVRGVRCSIVETTVGWQASREYMAMEADGLKTYKTQAQGQEFLYDPPVVRIKLPLQAGQTWTSTVNQSGMAMTTTNQTLGTERVQTSAGVFDCIKIRSTAALPGQPPMVSLSYYADGVGLVYQTVQAGGQELIATLVSRTIKPAPRPQLPPQSRQPQQTQPSGPAQRTAPAETAQKMRCPKCNALVDKNAKFCSECGAKIVRPVAPTRCPKCNTKLPPGAKFCPACGEKLALPAAAATGPDTPQTPVERAHQTAALDRYQSPDGTVQLYKPLGWTVQQETFEPGSMAVSVMEPEENAAVIFITFPVDPDIDDSVKLMARCMMGLREEYPDIQATSVASSPEKERTIAEMTLTAEGKKGIGHGYFFYTQRIGTVYFLLARQDMWDNMRPMLTNVAANLAYAPEGIEAVAQQAQSLADETPAAESSAPSPAALIKQASKRPGKQVALQSVALPDQSATLQIPLGWDFEGRKLEFVAVNNRQTQTHGMACTKHTIMATNTSIPGVINASYQPPAQALKLVLESGPTTRNVKVLSACPVEQAVPELAQSIQYMRAQGIQVDARLVVAQFTNVPTGITQRGFFSVQCSTSPMSPVWQVAIQGCWAPENEFEQWLPLFLRIEKTIEVNQQWFGQEMQGRAATQRRLNASLMNSIAESNQAFDDYMGSLRDADRSRDYTSHMWSQTTLGQGTWVAENEGAKIYQTDSWGIEGLEGRIDQQAFNTTHFTGENPWDGSQLEMVNTRDEYERYIANP